MRLHEAIDGPRDAVPGSSGLSLAMVIQQWMLRCSDSESAKTKEKWVVLRLEGSEAIMPVAEIGWVRRRRSVSTQSPREEALSVWGECGTLGMRPRI